MFSKQLLLMEFILNKKFAKYIPEHSVPNERVIAIKIRNSKHVRAGEPWSYEVANFYMEIYPQMMELGYSLTEFDSVQFGDDF